VLPSYNESLNILALIEALLSRPGDDRLLVDDSSPDGTGELVEQAIRDKAAGRPASSSSRAQKRMVAAGR